MKRFLAILTTLAAVSPLAFGMTSTAHAADWSALENSGSLADVRAAIYGPQAPSLDEAKIVRQFRQAAHFVREGMSCANSKDIRTTDFMGAVTTLDAINAFNDDASVKQMSQDLEAYAKDLMNQNRDDQLCH
jgi:hypothetical protein